MELTIEDKKSQIISWFFELRQLFFNNFEEIEKENGCNNTFIIKKWNFEHGSGGGEISILNGEVFEKVCVNISNVYDIKDVSKFYPINGDDNSTLWAAGISCIFHSQSPWIPTAHMNTRMMIKGDNLWFGGGGDLTPTFIIEQDTELFHSYMKEACQILGPEYYHRFKKQCDEYFFLPHRNEPRGIGGIFYDHLSSQHWDKDFEFTKTVGINFLKSFFKIARQNLKRTWTSQEKEQQLYKRGKYVEFNLLYDKGTRFGLNTGGNTEAIFCSMPPTAKW